jgi:hypothetical protein
MIELLVKYGAHEGACKYVFLIVVGVFGIGARVVVYMKRFTSQKSVLSNRFPI